MQNLELPKNGKLGGHGRHKSQIEGLIQKQLKSKINSMMVRRSHNKSWDLDSTMSSGNVSSQYSRPCEILDWNVNQLNPDHVKEIERCNKVPQSNPKLHYDYIAKNYEGMYLRVGFPDPKKVAEQVCNFTAKQPAKDLKILDMACGTGLVGKYLKDSGRGFGQIHGVDISTVMIEEAEQKGAYKKLEEITLSNPDEFPWHFKNKYDVVTCSGLINNNYMDYGLFEEMILALKKGGIAVFAARYSYMGQYWYEDVIQEMEKDGRWKCLKTETFFKYDQMLPSIGRFSKTPCKVYVFKNLQDELNTYKKKDEADTMGLFTKKQDQE